MSVSKDMEKMSRRRLLGLAAAAGAAAGVPRWAASEEPPAKKGKTLLILGGTRFLGPALVEAATAKGWTLTLFNRGKSNPGLFAGRDIEQIQGDRNVAE